MLVFSIWSSVITYLILTWMLIVSQKKTTPIEDNKLLLFLILLIIILIYTIIKINWHILFLEWCIVLFSLYPTVLTINSHKNKLDLIALKCEKYILTLLFLQIILQLIGLITIV